MKSGHSVGGIFGEGEDQKFPLLNQHIRDPKSLGDAISAALHLPTFHTGESLPLSQGNSYYCIVPPLSRQPH